MTTQDWNTELYDQKHAFVSAYGKGVIELLEAQPDEVILDLGCGTGHLAQSIAESGAHVVGIDSSPTMIEAARKTYPDSEFHVADASDFSFPNHFDAIFSNATLHWVLDAENAVRCIAAALKPGGRFVAELGGKGNVASIVTAIQQAVRELLQREVAAGWYFPSIGTYTQVLEKYALEVRSAVLFDRPTKLADGEAGLRNWIEMFGEHILRNLPDEIKPQIIALAEEKARTTLFKDGAWIADYRRLRVVAYKK